MRKSVAFVVAAMAAIAAPAPALAQEPARAEAPADDLVRVALDTAKGRIVLALDRGRAPITAGNFLAYIDGGKYDGESFYRAMPLTGGGLIQGGITTDGRKLRPAIAHEPPARTGLTHKKGTIAMAATAPGEARSDFFILTTDVPQFDDNFAPFGQVVEGMDVVEAIFKSPVSPTKGAGALKGEMLEPEIRIVKAARVKE